MNIYLEEGQAPADEMMDKLTEAACCVLDSEGVCKDRAQISLTLISPEEIRSLNRDYRGVDNVTDVLSFPQFESTDDLPEAGEICLGDVVICEDRVKEQADEYGHSYEREFIYLFVHSLLHLLGYDHMEDEEKAAMRYREEAVMNQLDLRR